MPWYTTPLSNVAQHSQASLCWLVKCHATLLSVVGCQDVMDLTISSSHLTPPSSASWLKLFIWNALVHHRMPLPSFMRTTDFSPASLFQPLSPCKKVMSRGQGRQQFLKEWRLSVRCLPTKFTIAQHHSNKILKIHHVTSLF